MMPDVNPRIATPSAEDGQAPLAIDEVLSLKPTGAGVWRAQIFEANPTGAVFGGTFLGQGLAAALATASDRPPSVMQARFLRAGDVQRPMDYQVETIRDGRSLSERRVIALQDEKVCFEALVSFHTPETGAAHAHSLVELKAAPEDLPPINALPGLYPGQILAKDAHRIGDYRALEGRLTDPLGYLAQITDPAGRYWVRARQAPTSASGYAVLAFLSDYMLAGASMLPHVGSVFQSSLAWITLNHTIWFHQAPDPAAWLLHDTVSHWAGSGRSLTHGRLYDRDGRLLASTAQECLVRTAPSEASPSQASG